MTDFTPTPEAVEAVAEAINTRNTLRAKTNAAIAAFVEAEGLTIHRTGYHPETGDTQVRGPWRKRD